MTNEWGDLARRLTDHVTVLSTPDNGAYPSGNSVVVRGAGETVIIDPSVTVVEKGGAGMPVDAVINSHGHEDHVGTRAFREPFALFGERARLEVEGGGAVGDLVVVDHPDRFGVVESC